MTKYYKKQFQSLLFRDLRFRVRQKYVTEEDVLKENKQEKILENLKKTITKNYNSLLVFNIQKSKFHSYRKSCHR